MYPTNDGPGIIHIPAKKFDMPNVVTKAWTPKILASTTDVSEFPGAVAKPNIKPNEANAAKVWQYTIAKALIEAIELATTRTTIGSTIGRSDMAPKRTRAKVLAPPIIETM